MSEIVTIYRGEKIRYNEFENNWSCDLIANSQLSLTELKKRLDKKLDEDGKVPFKKFCVWVPSFRYHGNGWRMVTVTSLTDDGKQAWITDGKEREKVGRSGSDSPIPIYAATPENAALVAQIQDCAGAIKGAQRRIKDLESRMTLHKIA